MLRNTILLIFMLNSTALLASDKNSKYFVFIGERISMEEVPPKEGEIPFKSQFLAKYRIIEPFKGCYSNDEIEFTVFDHYGVSPFSKFKHVLLYVESHEGKYYHSKYQYSPLYKTKSGKWAGTYAKYDYSHSYNEKTILRNGFLNRTIKLKEVKL